MGSLSLAPDTRGQLGHFVETQFKTKGRPPPSSTSFTGQTVMITGSNTCLGLECAKEMLGLHLSHLIMAVRTVAKGEKAAEPLRRQYPGAKIDVWALDMGNYDSIRSFARRCEESSPRLDIAILNAGVWPLAWTVNSNTGHEEAVQINYLSTALLSILLLPALKRSSRPGHPGRLTVVSSGLAMMSQWPQHTAIPLLPALDKRPEGNYGFDVSTERYSVTKTMELMLVLKLSQTVSADEVIINSVGPGLIRGTELHRDLGFLMRGAQRIFNTAGRSVQDAAWLYIDAVTLQGRESHGSYVKNYRLYPFHQMMYTDSGKRATEHLWEETLEELSFAGVREMTRPLGR
ncbi:hypothetical protein LTR53_003372 [Teratosphaeriaceae sp. CCFEE 6253]|nr:hypothetical protein LTR53_003372 [Teratosphaeriaceae sp. CCFEE 6253]